MPKKWNTTTVERVGARPTLTETTFSAPKNDEILVRIRAAALNFADLLMIEGKYQETPPFPFTPGLEGAGEVIEAGTDTDFRPGDRVAIYQQGTIAEAGLFKAANCCPIPDSMSFDDAAAFQIAYGTSHLALTARAGLKSGETLVVLGAAGGVGLTAVEIGAALGARVIAVARGADKLAATLEAGAGAGEAIDSDDCPDLKARLRELGGADVVYDPVGTSLGLAAFGALRQGGRFLLIGFAGGKPPELPLNHALVKNIAIHGFYWGAYRTLDPELMRDSMTQLFQMVSDGRLKPRATTAYPLAELEKAYDLLQNRRSIGKVTITI